MAYLVTLKVDNSELFDAVANAGQAGQTHLGSCLLEVMLCPEKISITTSVALACYGVIVSSVSSTAGDPS